LLRRTYVARSSPALREDGYYAERSRTAEHRAELLAGLPGRVTEAGARKRAQLRALLVLVSEVLAVEAGAYLRQRVCIRVSGRQAAYVELLYR
jgi:hypothetical protein